MFGWLCKSFSLSVLLSHYQWRSVGVWCPGQEVKLVPLVRAVASLTVPGGQEFHFPHFSSNRDQFFLLFPQTLLIFFLLLALRVGDSGKALATPLPLVMLVLIFSKEIFKMVDPKQISVILKSDTQKKKIKKLELCFYLFSNMFKAIHISSQQIITNWFCTLWSLTNQDDFSASPKVAPRTCASLFPPTPFHCNAFIRVTVRSLKRIRNAKSIFA